MTNIQKKKDTEKEEKQTGSAKRKKKQTTGSKKQFCNKKNCGIKKHENGKTAKKCRGKARKQINTLKKPQQYQSGIRLKKKEKPTKKNKQGHTMGNDKCKSSNKHESKVRTLEQK